MCLSNTYTTHTRVITLFYFRNERPPYNLKLQAEVENETKDLLTTIGETPAKKEKSSFEKAVEPYQEKKTRQEELSDNLDIIQNQMN